MSSLASIALGFLLIFHGQLQEPHPGFESREQASRRYFRVRDSIEMARFERSGGEPKFSPDRKYFAVVTSRGSLQSNQIESTLLVFRSDQARELLGTKGSGRQSIPKVLARLATIPQTQCFDSYGPLVSDLRWMPDSKTILFLGQNSHGKRQLHRADVLSGKDHTLTAEEYDVSQFEFVGSNITYVAVLPRESRTAGEPISAASWDVTGQPLTTILFPKMTTRQMPKELWVVHKGKGRRVREASTGQPVQVSNLPPRPYSVLSLSSDGRAAVVLVPSKAIPSSWQAYQPEFSFLRIHLGDADTTSDFWPMQYAMVDLNSGKTTPLVDAPNAWALGSADMNQAKWSPDGKKLLLTNTYLPLDDGVESEKSERLHHCVAAIVEPASKKGSCVVFSTENRASKYLINGSFGESDQEVVLDFWNTPNKTTLERYQYENGGWRLAGTISGRVHQGLEPLDRELYAATFSVVIEQDLNTPPALWATDRETGQSKKIWDPNPQLAAFNLGEASEFQWQDNTGYEWTGVLVKPPDYVRGKRYPLVIQTHGFQAGEFITDGAYTTAFAARPLASAGMMVLQMPTKHDRLVTGDEASDQIEGFESAVDRLAADGLINPEKVGIIGFSRTCYYVESALIKNPKRYAAATLADGVDESYVQYLLFGVGQSHDDSAQIYGSPPFGNGLKRWTERAPGFHLDQIETPLRIEAIAPASILEEWEIYASLWKQGKSVDLIYFPSGQHILQKPQERMDSQQGNVDWFCFWLKGEEDPDPTRAGQYTRWRELRKLQEQNEKKSANAAPPTSN